ncbi:MAG: peptidoglycan editing factor PgeF [Armatimonadota bacterium]
MNDTDAENVPRFWQSSGLSRLPWLTHGVTERGGGTSAAPFASLNLGLHVGDAAERVRENRGRVATAAGLTLSRMVCGEQVHGSEAAVVTAGDAGRGAAVFSEAIPGVDALVTDAPDLLLTLFFADCLPILLADTEHRVVAVAHAGWRGMVGGVIENTLTTMQRQFGTRAEAIVAAVGPGIRSCCFEVGPEVAEQFPLSMVHQSPGGKPHVDLHGAARLRLLDRGIHSYQIESAELCTACHTERFFSHRRENGRTGRMGAFIALRSA